MLMVMYCLEAALVLESQLLMPFLNLRLEGVGQGEDLWWMDLGDLVKGLEKGLEKGLGKELKKELKKEPLRGL
jgi:hypothetical protein